MQKNINYGAIISVILAIVLIIGGIWTYSANAELKDSIEAKDNALTSSQDTILGLGQKVEELGNNVINLQEEIKEKDALIEEVETIEEPQGYLIDKISIGQGIDKEITSKNIDLFKGSVEVNDKDYKFEEIIYLNGLDVTANGKSYGSNVYSVLDENEIKYIVEFKKEVSDIDNENSLIFNFLGKEVEVTDWDGDSITIRYGDEKVVSEGQILTIDGKEVTVDFITSNSVYFIVDGVGKNIKENSYSTVNGVKIAVSDVLYSEKQTSKAVIRLGENLQDTFTDGEEYEEDSIWKWVIDDYSIGIALDETFKWLDDENLPLGSGDKICLPNEYKCIQFNGLDEINYQDITFKVRDNGELRITGDEFNNLVVYSNGTLQFYDEKEKEYLNEIELENSDLVMKVIKEITYHLHSHYPTIKYYVVIVDGSTELVRVPLNVKSVIVEGSNIEQKDDYRSTYGIIVKSTEDIAEDQVLYISVPEEKVQASFLIY